MYNVSTSDATFAFSCFEIKDVDSCIPESLDEGSPLELKSLSCTTLLYEIFLQRNQSEFFFQSCGPFIMIKKIFQKWP